MSWQTPVLTGQSGRQPPYHSDHCGRCSHQVVADVRVLSSEHGEQFGAGDGPAKWYCYGRFRAGRRLYRRQVLEIRRSAGSDYCLVGLKLRNLVIFLPLTGRKKSFHNPITIPLFRTCVNYAIFKILRIFGFQFLKILWNSRFCGRRPPEVFVNSSYWTNWWVNFVLFCYIECFIFSTTIAVSWFSNAFQNIPLIVGHRAEQEHISRILRIAIQHDERIICLDHVMVYHIGEKALVEVHVVLDEQLPLRITHDLTEALEQKLKSLDFVDRVFLHVDYRCDGHLDGQ